MLKRRRSHAGLLFLAFGVLLVAWWLRSEGSAEPEVLRTESAPTASGTVAEVLPADLAVRGAREPRGEEQGSPGSPATPETWIEVRWEHDASPVEGARVALLWCPPEEDAVPGIIPSDFSFEVVTTRETGIAHFRVAGPARGVLVTAKGAFDVRRGEVPIGSRSAVELRRAPLITGRVVTTSGVPVDGVLIEAIPANIPMAVAEDRGKWAEWRFARLPMSRTATDAAGSFTLPAMSDGPHRVYVSGPWGISRAHAPLDATTVTWRPSDPALEIVVEPLAVVQVRLVDAETRQPLRLPIGTVEMFVDDPAVLSQSDHQPWTWTGGDLRIHGPCDAQDPSILRRLVRGIAVSPQTAPVAVDIDATGYGRVRVSARLSTLQDALRVEAVEEVPLRRQGEGPDSGPGVLVCTGVEAPPGYELGDGVLLALGGAAGSSGGMYAGHRVGHSAWEFRGLPLGDFQARLGVGWLGSSDTFRVSLGSHRDSRVEVTFKDATWVSFELQSEAQRPVFDAESISVVSRDGGKLLKKPGVLPSSVTSVSVDPLKGATRRRVIQLLPGSYTVTCQKSGFAPTRVDFEVETGPLLRVLVVMKPGTDVAK